MITLDIDTQIKLAYTIVVIAIIIALIFIIRQKLKIRYYKAYGLVRVIDLDNNKMFFTRIKFDDKNNTFYIKRFFKRYNLSKNIYPENTIIFYKTRPFEISENGLKEQVITQQELDKIIKLNLLSLGRFGLSGYIWYIIIGIAIGFGFGYMAYPYLYKPPPINPVPPSTTTQTFTQLPKIIMSFLLGG